ncbi:MAG: AraC family transcriptional regulator [Polaribacter sp.]|uniref:helix-turn-helix domain-containing protein n=1 Tax=Polaribacter sp. TaxID=1920175 RepID=UPI002F352F6F
MELSPNYTFINTFIIGATSLGFIYSLSILFSSKHNSKTNKYLIYTILLLSIYNLYYWFIDTKLNVILGWKNYRAIFYITWELLMLPMYLFFVATYLNKKEEIKNHYKYPFYFTFIVHGFILIGRFTIKDFFKTYKTILCVYDTFLDYFSLIFGMFMIYKILKIIYNYEKEKKEYSINIILSETKWLKQLLFSTLGFCLLSFSILLYNSMNADKPIKTDFIWAIMSIFLYWLCFAGIYHVGIFNQRKTIRKSLSIETNKIAKINCNNRFSEIDEYIKNNKSYLNPNLTLAHLSDVFDLSEGYLSQLINTNTKVNFSTYINNLRVEKSKLLLTNPAYKNYTIIAIALESGFNSKSVFYNSFKKGTGVSPSQFKKII